MIGKKFNYPWGVGGVMEIIPYARPKLEQSNMGLWWIVAKFIVHYKDGRIWTGKTGFSITTVNKLDGDAGRYVTTLIKRAMSKVSYKE